MLQDEQDLGTEETDFRIKDLLSWLNILSNRQIAAYIQKKNEPIKEKSFVEESVLFIFPHQTNGNGNHVPEPEAVGHVISERHGKSTFDFSEIEQLRIEARNSMANSDIYFPIFSETIHTILKIFSQHDLTKVSRQVKVTVKKIGCQNFWPKVLASLLQRLYL